MKQYEVAIDADRLNASGLTVADVYEALEAGNENTGGSYIEKNSNQYFIRGIGLATSLEDIGKIPMKTIGGTPILVRDVANVQFEYATRYGAVTRNGEGEVVAGITLMLKGENFQQVIKNVKERMAQIQKSLPEGVVIEPFIDRTQLVDRVTGTITRNLIEGGLIVVFILVLFLGNYRAGLVVATVIPLSMLFAFGMMKLFGVSGNLMSLGAIDFGLIVDGAVIIVEAVCHHIGISRDKYRGTRLTQAEKILKVQFPEVKQAVTRIGSSEIPTDPMPMERADMLISLIPEAEWTSAKTKDELMEKMEEALSIIPGMEVEMTQPIQMHNNELITGIKQDVAIKIYGNDLDALESSAKKVASLIKNVDGVSEPFVEKVQGQPQIQVKYDRDRLAKYGISITTANRVLEAAFAGRRTGYVFEEDRRFDMVVRMDNDLRNDLEALEGLYLPLPDGGTLPLRQVAEISFENAPAQITHEDGQRRIYVGFNVRGRDVQSTVEDNSKPVVRVPHCLRRTAQVPKSGNGSSAEQSGGDTQKAE